MNPSYMKARIKGIEMVRDYNVREAESMEDDLWRDLALSIKRNQCKEMMVCLGLWGAYLALHVPQPIVQVANVG